MTSQAILDLHMSSMEFPNRSQHAGSILSGFRLLHNLCLNRRKAPDLKKTDTRAE